ncbi:MAG: transcription-repair coupling factor [Phycisphaera sp.]|nr:transcription-repair coupling factor [Phycisphaera sp.]
MTHDWLDILLNDPAITTLCDRLGERESIAAEGAWGSAAHLLAGALRVRTGRPVLIVVGHLDDADEAVSDLELFDGVSGSVFPALEVLPGESNVSLELLAERLGMVTRLLDGDQPDVIVAPVQALMQAVPQREAIGGMTRRVERGMTLDQQELAHWLDAAGYQRVDVIDEVGDFAVRGGIVDICPPGNLPPVRIDFFGDEVDEIAEIDLASMGSDRKLKSIHLIGASADQVQSDTRTTSLWELLRADTIVVMCETLEIDEQARAYYERLIDPTGIYAPRSVHEQARRFAQVDVNQFAAPGMAEQRVALPVRAVPNFDSDAAKAIDELVELAADHRVIVTCRREGEAERLRELLAEHESAALQNVQIVSGYLYRGFIWGAAGNDALQTAIVPHHELFHRYQARRRIRRVSVGARDVDAFLDIEPGDYVVHTHHGVARFKGLRVMKRDGDDAGEEYLTLEFAEKALLHVPASEIEHVQKYVGGFAGRPQLSKLGGARWKKQKEQVAEAVKDMAAELLRVQAARQSIPGIAFPADTTWMKRFEAEFPCEETDDQLAAIAKIKRDMAEPRPMDRLICGDVGYGKTELAMRAAFKAVEAGYQVAVLCPTTVLSEQHERTFRERMADYPVRIETLNRFKSTTEVRDTLRGAKDGGVDILIGTHRLLSEDVTFAKLGMVIVDEEQKFGVEHKNRLMRFRVTVDVLTMSATPIPRTLHMAMLGLRDISSLSTPPADRRAIVTEVIQHERPRIRQAILRELNRDGQVYFVHNRVHNIHTVANEIRSMVPEAAVAVGHGQMSGHELEDVMLRFVRGEVDVLVCTTIIESGIDIPRANTMFIADCDRFGLAEMHQLRGRVGRYKHRAYCYLLLPQTRTLTEVATRRLRAIEEFSMLGAGFKIAMRDMEIRGVGNLLGPEQSGHIAAVGYDLYCQLLEQSTRQLRNEPAPNVPSEVHLELKIHGNLPRRYIPSDRHRMEAYRRIGRAPDFDTLRSVERSLVDAYGELPSSAEVLMQLAEIRLALASMRVEALKLDGPDLIFTTAEPKRLSPKLEFAPGSVRLVDMPGPDTPGTIYYRPPKAYLDEPRTMLNVLRKLLVGAKHMRGDAGAKPK